jgi:hypothetical protein
MNKILTGFVLQVFLVPQKVEIFRVSLTAGSDREVNHFESEGGTVAAATQRQSMGFNFGTDFHPQSQNEIQDSNEEKCFTNAD